MDFHTPHTHTLTHCYYITKTILCSASRVDSLLITFVNLLFFPTSVALGSGVRWERMLFTGLCVPGDVFLFISLMPGSPCICPPWPSGYQFLAADAANSKAHEER